LGFNREELHRPTERIFWRLAHLQIELAKDLLKKPGLLLDKTNQPFRYG
jgi:hypothetical protein